MPRIHPGPSLAILLVVALIDPRQVARGDEFAIAWQRVEERTLALSTKYSIKVIVVKEAMESAGTNYAIAPVEKYSSHLSILEKEIEIYPIDFLKKIGLKKIILCGGITLYGNHYGGYTERLMGNVVYDVAREYPDPKTRLADSRLTFHHELFHVLDDQIHFDRSSRFYSDPQWKALNPPGFLYHNLGGPKPDRIGLDSSTPGFLTGYSRYSINEDKAEVFAWKITRPNVIDERARIDKILEKKSRHLEAVISRFAPEIDGRFWAERQKNSE